MTGTAGRRGWLLAIDTATSRIVVAAGDSSGVLIRAIEGPAGHRHGERLLRAVEQLLAETGLERDDLAGIVVGTGPGAFTGLRVGLATAKTLAHAMDRPIAGVATGAALLRAAAQPAASATGSLVLLLPAGPHDRVEVRDDAAPRLLPGGEEPDLRPGEVLVAVDLDGRAPADAVARGAAALEGLAAALVALGAGRLAAGAIDDAAGLIPEYVTLPRGVRAASGEIAWSHGRR